MEIEDAIAALARQTPMLGSREDPAAFRDALLTHARNHAQSTPHGARAAGMVVAYAAANYIALDAAVHVYWQEHCQPPAPEWVEVEGRGITAPIWGAGGDFSIMREGSGNVVVEIADKRFRIRFEPPLEGHRLIIERKRGDA